MDRRDFLLMKTKGRQRVLELSCERLYMRWADARSGAGGVGTGEGPMDETQSWEGEPPTEIVTTTTGGLLGELDRELARADVLRVLGRDWLSDADFRSDVESRVQAFRAHGGRVE
jgi:hypothetical protein